MDERIRLRWVWLGTCALVLGACVIEGEYLPDIPPPGSIIGAAIRTPQCGDGVRDQTEACDDGNALPGDGCDAKCTVELCFVCSDDPTSSRSTCGPACNESAGQTCYQGVCVSCTDGIKNGLEADVDCGGGCYPCNVSRTCSSVADCATGFCVAGICCNESCDGLCIRCDLPDSLGICAFVPEGQTHEDLLFTCRETSACDGKGACKKLSAEKCAAGIECISGKCVTGVCQ